MVRARDRDVRGASGHASAVARHQAPAEALARASAAAACSGPGRAVSSDSAELEAARSRGVACAGQRLDRVEHGGARRRARAARTNEVVDVVAVVADHLGEQAFVGIEKRRAGRFVIAEKNEISSVVFRSGLCVSRTCGAFRESLVFHGSDATNSPTCSAVVGRPISLSENTYEREGLDGTT